MILINTVYIIVAGILWGIISLFVTQLQSLGLSSMEIVTLRVFFSAVILSVYILIKDKSKLKINPKDIPLFIGTGIGSIVFFNFCYFEAIEIIGGASVPALLLYTAPIFVMIISLFLFREKITVRKILSLVITFTGLILVTGAFSSGEKLSPKAVLLGLGSGLGYALYSIFGKYLVPKYNSLTVTVWTFIIATLGAVPFSGILTDIQLFMNWKGLICSVMLAFLSTVLPFLFYTKGLSGTDAGKASILATIEPFVATVVGITVFDEKITAVKITGMLLILAAMIILNIGSKSKTNK